MTVQLNITEAKAHLGELIRRSQAGEQVLIAKAGRPLIRLVPWDAHDAEPRPRPLGLLEGRLLIPDDFNRMGQVEFAGLD